MQPNDVMIFPRGAEHDVMTKGKNIHVSTITLPETVWSSFLSDQKADVANNWGFWHMGRFAADYRKFFGELPSETLQKQKND